MTPAIVVMTSAEGKKRLEQLKLAEQLDLPWQVFGAWFYAIMPSEPWAEQAKVELRQMFNGDLSLAFKEIGFKAKLVMTDVDATFIQEECIDSLARVCGRGDEVARLTEKAMLGAFDFAQSLQQRVAMLAGLSKAQLEDVAESLTLQPGARGFSAWCASKQIPLLAVSGGFVDILDLVAGHWGLLGYHANRLEIRGDQFTGRVSGAIVDAQEKQRWLLQKSQEFNCSIEDTVALGDGANDFYMLEKAGLAIGFGPKPVLFPILDVLNNTGSHKFHHDFLRLLEDLA